MIYNPTDIAKKVVIYGKNTSGSTIHKGDAVSIVSAGGSFTAFGLCDATTAQSAYAFVGLASQTLAPNDFGYVTKAGTVSDIDTSSYDEGKPVYVLASTPGDLTKTFPTPPTYIINVGMVEYKHANHGRINVIPLIVPRLEDLSDADGTPLTVTGQFPVWNQTAGYFDFNYNITDYLTIATAGTTYLKLDQTTPQTVANGTPIFSGGLNTATTSSSFASYPTTANRNNYTGSVGFGFTVAANTIVSRLGRLYVVGNSQNHNINLWDSTDTTTPIATGTILAASTSDANNFKWVSITPVLLQTGRTYYIALDENSGGDQWLNEWTPSMNTNFTVQQSRYGSTGAFPSSGGTVGTMFNTINIEFTLGTTISATQITSPTLSAVTQKTTALYFDKAYPKFTGGIMEFIDNVNDQHRLRVTNASTGNNAVARIEVNNGGTDVTSFGIFGANKTAYGAIASGQGFFYSNSSLGLTLMTDYAVGAVKAPIIFATGGQNERWRVDGDGKLKATTGTIYPAADSTTAIQFNKADSTTNVLTLDTTTPKITTFGNLLVNNGDVEARRVHIGELNSAPGNYPGIWFGANATTPSYTNYSFLYDSSTGAVFNSTTRTNFRISNDTSYQAYFNKNGSKIQLNIDGNLRLMHSTTGSNGIFIGGLNSAYPGIWFHAASENPTYTNYSFLSDGDGGCLFNANSGKNITFRINNLDYFKIIGATGYFDIQSRDGSSTYSMNGAPTLRMVPDTLVWSDSLNSTYFQLGDTSGLFTGLGGVDFERFQISTKCMILGGYYPGGISSPDALVGVYNDWNSGSARVALQIRGNRTQSADLFQIYQGAANHAKGTLLFNVAYDGKVSIGAGATASAKTHILSTTEQLRLGYDASNYLSATVGSTGSTTFALTGTTPTFSFSQKVGVGVATPSAGVHSLFTTEQLRLGYDANNYLSFTVGSANAVTIANKVAADITINAGTDKTLVLGETVWGDIDFPIIIRTTGTGIPALTTFNGNITMPQWAVNDYNVCESQELVHEWKEGTECFWHLHLTTNGLDATDRYVKFEVEYGYNNGHNTAWTFPTAITTADLLIPANTPDKTMLILSLGSFTPSSAKIGAHVVARLKRVTASGTAPTNNPWIPMLQMHIEKDTLGSRQITAK